MRLRRVLPLFVALGAGVALSARAEINIAEPPVDAPPPSVPYSGLTPDFEKMTEAPPVSAPTSAVVIWSGFRRLDDGRARFFLHSTAPFFYTPYTHPGVYTIRLPKTKIATTNHSRVLDTKHFDVSVNSARIRRRSGAVEWVFSGPKSASDVKQYKAPDGSHYLVVTFPPR